MKYHIVVSNDVHNQLAESAIQLEALKPGAGVRFIEAYEEAIALLKMFPFAYRVQKEDWRIIPLSPFAYILVYKIGPDTVYVGRLIHIKASPRKRFR